jgi:hypothetical protein
VSLSQGRQAHISERQEQVSDLLVAKAKALVATRFVVISFSFHAPSHLRPRTLGREAPTVPAYPVGGLIATLMAKPLAISDGG